MRKKANKKVVISDDKLWYAHDREGLKQFGKRRWNQANVGWYTEEGQISSKIYGKRVLVFTSAVNGSHIEHETEDYLLAQ